jgi:transcriptional antiterminator RfaH
MNQRHMTAHEENFDSQPLVPAAWYVVQTKPRQEYRALENLINQGYECVLPEYQCERLRHGVRMLRNEPLFPRYLFIHLDTVSMNWGPIRSTYGVIGLVRFGGVPASMPEGMVEAVMNRGAPQQNLFIAGDRVSITEARLLVWKEFSIRMTVLPGS